MIEVGPLGSAPTGGESARPTVANAVAAAIAAAADAAIRCL
jgi:hypothetical protein